jgi:hypothetical protein
LFTLGVFEFQNFRKPRFQLMLSQFKLPSILAWKSSKRVERLQRPSKRNFFSNPLPNLIQSVLKSALDETSELIRPNVGWLNGSKSVPQTLLDSPLNHSKDFEAIVGHLRSGAPLEDWPQSAKPYAFVFVGGLWSHLYPLSYVPSLRGMLSHGVVTNRITTLDSRLSVDVNGILLASELRQVIVENPSKRLIIMAHSKGSLDTLEAVRVDPSLAPHIHRLISIQSPFGGSPYAAAYLNSTSFARMVVDQMLIQWMAGDYSGVQSLTYEARKEWFARTPTVPIPVLCFASSAHPSGLIPEDLSKYMYDTFGAENDGLVAQADAILPGAPFVLAKGISHLAPVFNDIPHCDILPSIFIQALCYMATRKRGLLDLRLDADKASL